MDFWYHIDEPRNSPCWIVNPNLWKRFETIFNGVNGKNPERNAIYTEQYIVQMLDDGYGRLEEGYAS